jgi:hypothetical protein
MSTRKMIRWSLLAVSVGVALWHAAPVIEALTSVRAGREPATAPHAFGGGLVPGLPLGLPAAAGAPQAAQATQLAALQAALAGAAGQTQNAADAAKDNKPADDLVIYGPAGQTLTEAQKQAILREAARQRSAPKTAPAPTKP